MSANDHERFRTAELGTDYTAEFDQEGRRLTLYTTGARWGMNLQTARALRDFLDLVLPRENEATKSPFPVTIHTLTAEQLADVLCSAFEGGSNYWYWIDQFIEPSAWQFESEPRAEQGKHYVQDYVLNPGGALLISDKLDDDDREAKRLDAEALQRGLTILAEKYPHHFANILAENSDAFTGDALLQCCLFGEIVYG